MSQDFCCCVQRHHDHGKTYKGESLIGTGFQLRGLVHYRNGKKCGDMQTDMALGWQLRGLYLNPQAEEKESHTDHAWSICDPKAYTK